MAFVQSLHRSFVFPLEKIRYARNKPCSSQHHQRVVVLKTVTRHAKLGIQATSGVNTETANVDETDEKSEVYSSNMSNAMETDLTYRHERGINYNFVLADLILGSCLQSPEDVNKLREIGVGTIFCLQKDSDLDYFGVDITAIQEHAKEYGLQHVRAEIRDFDPFDLRMKLPSAVAKLDMAIKNGHGIVYVHCTAGLCRAPAVVLSYMYWILSYKLSEAYKLLQIIGGDKQQVTLKWQKRPCSNVEVSGLDIGWDQRLPMAFDEIQGYWVLHRDLPVGRYEYKYVIDGNWVYNADELVTQINVDGHVNNYIEVKDDHLDDMAKRTIERLMHGDADLTEIERKIIREKLEALSNAD